MAFLLENWKSPKTRENNLVAQIISLHNNRSRSQILIFLSQTSVFGNFTWKHTFVQIFWNSHIRIPNILISKSKWNNKSNGQSLQNMNSMWMGNGSRRTRSAKSFKTAWFTLIWHTSIFGFSNYCGKSCARIVEFLSTSMQILNYFIKIKNLAHSKFLNQVCLKFGHTYVVLSRHQPTTTVHGSQNSRKTFTHTFGWNFFFTLQCWSEQNFQETVCMNGIPEFWEPWVVKYS